MITFPFLFPPEMHSCDILRSIEYGNNILKHYDANTKYLLLISPYGKINIYPASQDGNSALRQECRDFMPLFKEEIGIPGLFDLNKKKVLKHLEQTRFILCSQLPTADIDDDGYEVNAQLMKIFENECDGMIQCDGEGFYSGVKLILKV